jgi:hypothetical protein
MKQIKLLCRNINMITVYLSDDDIWATDTYQGNVVYEVHARFVGPNIRQLL